MARGPKAHEGALARADRAAREQEPCEEEREQNGESVGRQRFDVTNRPRPSRPYQSRDRRECGGDHQTMQGERRRLEAHAAVSLGSGPVLHTMALVDLSGFAILASGDLTAGGARHGREPMAAAARAV